MQNDIANLVIKVKCYAINCELIVGESPGLHFATDAKRNFIGA